MLWLTALACNIWAYISSVDLRRKKLSWPPHNPSFTKLVRSRWMNIYLVRFCVIMISTASSRSMKTWKRTWLISSHANWPNPWSVMHISFLNNNYWIFTPEMTNDFFSLKVIVFITLEWRQNGCLNMNFVCRNFKKALQSSTFCLNILLLALINITRMELLFRYELKTTSSRTGSV